MYLELKIFGMHNVLFSLFELETNGLAFSARHIFLGLPLACRLHKMHHRFCYFNSLKGDGNELFCELSYVVFVCHFASQLVSIETCFEHGYLWATSLEPAIKNGVGVSIICSSFVGFENVSNLTVA